MIERFFKGCDGLNVGDARVEGDLFTNDQLAEGYADEFRGLQTESCENRFGFES